MRIAICLALVSLVACGASLKSIDFNVNESGKSVPVKRNWVDGFGGTEATKAFDALQKGDKDGATKILQADVAAHPDAWWDHWDLAVIAETNGDWATAETEVKTDIELRKKNKENTNDEEKELAFIEAHKGK